MSQQKYFIDVSKTFNNGGKRVRNHRKSKPLVVAFYINQSGKISKKIIRNKFTYFYLKYIKPKYRKTRFTCKYCKNKYEYIRKSSHKKLKMCNSCKFTVDR